MTDWIRNRAPKVVLGTVGHDAHIAGSSVLKFALEEAGARVIFLHAHVEPKEFVDAAREADADAIWVSSLYGMGRMDLEDFGQMCAEAGLADVPKYVGGILVTDPEDWQITEKLFKDLGFDRVYPPQTKPEVPIQDLEIDLKAQEQMS